jgi:hypothetical protein
MFAKLSSLAVRFVALALLTIVTATAYAQSTAERVTVVSNDGRGQTIVARSDAAGAIHVLSDAPDGPWYTKSTDGGATFSKPLNLINDEVRKPGLIYSVSDMAIGKDGRLHVAMNANHWKLKLPREEWGLFYVTLDPDAVAFSPVRNINRQPSEGFSLAADGKGNVTACWLADKLYVNVSRDNGKTFSATQELNPAYNPCNCCTTSSVYTADGKLAIFYREETNNNRDMYLILWDQKRNQESNQRVSGLPWKVDACPMTYYAVAPTPNGFTAVWPTKGDIYYARLNAQGKVLPPGEIKTPGASGMRTGSMVLNATDGATLVAWKKDSQLGWQIYDKNGRPQGPAGSTNSPGAGCAGVVDAAGRFVLVR